MQEYHFNIQYDDFTAELAIGSDQSFNAPVQFIIESVGFDFDHTFQFCDNLKYPSPVYSPARAIRASSMFSVLLMHMMRASLACLQQGLGSVENRPH